MNNLIPHIFQSVVLNEIGDIVERASFQTNKISVAVGRCEPIEMIEIPSGSFEMGSEESDIGARPNEFPRHVVDVSGFLIGKITVTQTQWSAVMEWLPNISESFRGEHLPVVNVWLEDALEYCERLKRLTGLNFRLPAEAEWEYACRAGSTFAFGFGAAISADLANFDGSAPFGDLAPTKASDGLRAAASYGVANRFGLYDMHGNVWEWCSDIWHENYVQAPKTATPWIENGDRGYCVQRGGAWNSSAADCRSAARVGDVAHNRDNIVGLRLCLSSDSVLSKPPA